MDNVRTELIERKGRRVAALKPESPKKLAETQQRHHAARHAWSESANPVEITEETYVGQIQPWLAANTIAALASALGVSISYAADIRKGRRRPHPRHWHALAELEGVNSQFHSIA